MGVEYELLDTKNRRSFDLGKGMWRNAFERIQASRPSNPAEMADAVRLAWVEGALMSRPDMIAYIDRLAERVQAFGESAGWELRLWNDASGDVEDLARFERVGSRYESDGPESFAEENAQRAVIRATADCTCLPTYDRAGRFVGHYPAPSCAVHPPRTP